MAEQLPKDNNNGNNGTNTNPNSNYQNYNTNDLYAEKIRRLEQQLKEAEKIKEQNQELQNFKINVENEKFLNKHQIKKNMKEHVAKLIRGEKDPEEFIKNLKEKTPEFFSSKAIKIGDDLNKTHGETPATEKKEWNEITKLQRKVGG